MRGRWEDAWLSQVYKSPITQMLNHLCLAGFRGVEVDRAAYQDYGRAFENGLQPIIGNPAIVSSDGRYAFYDLTDYGLRTKDQFSAEAWNALVQAEFDTVFIRPGDGMGPLESRSEHTWRWCNPESAIIFYNRFSSAHVVELRMSIHTGYSVPAHLVIEYPGGKEEIQISSTGSYYQHSIRVPPGRSLMKLHSDVKPFRAPGDPRLLFWRVDDLRVYQARDQHTSLFPQEDFSILN